MRGGLSAGARSESPCCACSLCDGVVAAQRAIAGCGSCLVCEPIQSVGRTSVVTRCHGVGDPETARRALTIERKSLKKTARVRGTWLCLAALCLGAPSCISPDLEPPSPGASASLPTVPTAPTAPTAQQGPKAQMPGTAAAGAPSSGAPPTGTPGKPSGTTAGQTATDPMRPAMMPAGVAGAAAASDQDADAGANPLP